MFNFKRAGLSLKKQEILATVGGEPSSKLLPWRTTGVRCLSYQNRDPENAGKSKN